jgi:hypothetical protein
MKCLVITPGGIKGNVLNFSHKNQTSLHPEKDVECKKSEQRQILPITLGEAQAIGEDEVKKRMQYLVISESGSRPRW